jgi:hypothetical protein
LRPAFGPFCAALIESNAQRHGATILVRSKNQILGPAIMLTPRPTHLYETVKRDSCCDVTDDCAIATLATYANCIAHVARLLVMMAVSSSDASTRHVDHSAIYTA